MSRVGNKAIVLPAKVTVKNDGGTVTVEGPKGKLSWTLPQGISLSAEGTTLTFKRATEDRKLRALHDGSFDARDDAAEMIAAMADPEAQEIGREYIRKILGK